MINKADFTLLYFIIHLWIDKPSLVYEIMWTNWILKLQAIKSYFIVSDG